MDSQASNLNSVAIPRVASGHTKVVRPESVTASKGQVSIEHEVIFNSLEPNAIRMGCNRTGRLVTKEGNSKMKGSIKVPIHRSDPKTAKNQGVSEGEKQRQREIEVKPVETYRHVTDSWRRPSFATTSAIFPSCGQKGDLGVEQRSSPRPTRVERPPD
ncbi:hypothetical protein RUM44_009088 [Polyplax serrata]|uniref:Uncharacterized protein n=1 Tax=Polyplax serrata TaxID=468196 RepID=A0ABR1ATD6_POLSC